MSHIPPVVLDQLNAVASDVFEQAAAEAFTIDKGMSANDSFQTDRTVSSPMRRAIVKAASKRAASIAGLHPRDTAGGGVELVSNYDNRRRFFRVKTAVPLDDGTYRVVAGAGSSLLHLPSSEGMLGWWDELWILGCVWADDHTLRELFVAEILGAASNATSGPVQLLLGPVSYLTGVPAPDDFESDTDDDLGETFDDDREEGVDGEKSGGVA